MTFFTRERPTNKAEFLSTNNHTVTLKPTAPSTQTTLPFTLKLSLGACLVVMVIIGFLGNLIVCLIVYKKPAMRSAINLLLANMALSDILISIICMPFSFLTLVTDKWILGNSLCDILAFLQEFLAGVGIFILLTISVDRYLIIVRRKDKLTTCHAKMFISCAWFMSAIQAALPILGWGKYKFYTGHTQCILEISKNAANISYAILKVSFTFFIPIIVMGFSYACILNTVRKNKVRIQNVPDKFCVSMTPASERLGLPSVYHQPSRLHVDMSFKTRAFKTILILFLILAICWIPYSVNMLHSNLTGSLNNIRNTTFLWLGYLNSTINPIIYSMRIPKFREACKDMVPKSFRFTTNISTTTKRRVNPSSVYECHEPQSS